MTTLDEEIIFMAYYETGSISDFVKKKDLDSDYDFPLEMGFLSLYATTNEEKYADMLDDDVEEGYNSLTDLNGFLLNKSYGQIRSTGVKMIDVGSFKNIWDASEAIDTILEEYAEKYDLVKGDRESYNDLDIDNDDIGFTSEKEFVKTLNNYISDMMDCVYEPNFRGTIKDFITEFQDYSPFTLALAIQNNNTSKKFIKRYKNHMISLYRKENPSTENILTPLKLIKN